MQASEIHGNPLMHVPPETLTGQVPGMMTQSCSEENFSIETAGLVVFTGLSVFSEELFCMSAIKMPLVTF